MECAVNYDRLPLVTCKVSSCDQQPTNQFFLPLYYNLFLRGGVYNTRVHVYNTYTAGTGLQRTGYLYDTRLINSTIFFFFQWSRQK